MVERRTRVQDQDTAIAVAEESERTAARTAHQRYETERRVDEQEAQRLVALRDKAAEEGLSGEEGIERLVLEASREDRESRLQRLLKEALTLQEEVSIQDVLATWEGLTAQKQEAYERVRMALQELYQAWRQVFDIHLIQEQARTSLPRDGSTPSTFPSGAELALWLTSRMPRGWGEVLTSPEQQAWQVDWLSVLDVDPGLKPLHETTIGRIKERALAWRTKMADRVVMDEETAQ